MSLGGGGPSGAYGKIGGSAPGKGSGIFQGVGDTLKNLGISGGDLLGAFGLGGGRASNVQSSSSSSVAANVSPNITVITNGGTASPYSSGSPMATATASPSASQTTGTPGGGSVWDALGGFGSSDPYTGIPGPSAPGDSGGDGFGDLPILPLLLAGGGALLFMNM